MTPRLFELASQLRRIERLALEARVALEVEDPDTVARRFTELQDSAVVEAARMLDAASAEDELRTAVVVASGRAAPLEERHLMRIADAVAAYEDVLPNDPLVLRAKQILAKGSASFDPAGALDVATRLGDAAVKAGAFVTSRLTEQRDCICPDPEVEKWSSCPFHFPVLSGGAKPFALPLVNADAFSGVHEALQQYLDNQVELDPGQVPTPRTIEVQKLVDALDAIVAQQAEPKGGGS